MGKYRGERSLNLSRSDILKLFHEIEAWFIGVRLVLDQSKRAKNDFTDEEYRHKYIKEKIEKINYGWNHAPATIEARLKNIFHYDRRRPDCWLVDGEYLSINTINERAEKRRDLIEKRFQEINKAGNSPVEVQDLYTELIMDEDLLLTDIEKSEVRHYIEDIYSGFKFNDSNDRNNIKRLCIYKVLSDRNLKKLIRNGGQLSKQDAETLSKMSDVILKTEKTLGVEAKDRQQAEKGENSLEMFLKLGAQEVENPNKGLMYCMEELIVLVRMVLSGKLHKNTMPVYVNITFEEALEVLIRHTSFKHEEKLLSDKDVSIKLIEEHPDVVDNVLLDKINEETSVGYQKLHIEDYDALKRRTLKEVTGLDIEERN